jgi:hypothetical protein
MGSRRGGRLSTLPPVFTWLHVSSARNRDSIAEHGLDSARMGAARGIAGSQRPEADGIFLCRDEGEAQFFLRMNNTGGPVDVWAVAGVDPGQLTDNGHGFLYLPGRVAAERVTLSHADATPSDGWTRLG